MRVSVRMKGGAGRKLYFTLNNVWVFDPARPDEKLVEVVGKQKSARSTWPIDRVTPEDDEAAACLAWLRMGGP